MLGITQQKHYKSHVNCKHKKTKYRPEILMENLSQITIEQMMWIPLMHPKYENLSKE